MSHAVLGPIARLLVRLGVSPDVVTIAGTLGVAIGALICFPQGWRKAIVVTIFVVSDMIDGLMAKITGKTSNWGAWTPPQTGWATLLSSEASCSTSCTGRTRHWAAIALAALVFGQWTSYVKARAESLGFTCTGGLAACGSARDHPRRAFLAGLGVPYVLQIAVAALAVTSMITVLQRIAQVRKQAARAERP